MSTNQSAGAGWTAGTLPAAAQSRIQRFAQGGSVASSLSSYSEHVLLQDMGFEPISAVVGLSVVHLGQIQVAGLKQPVELEAYSNAISMGLLYALTRVQQEAHLLGADGVLLQSIDEKNFDGEEHLYSMQGTALRFTPHPGGLRTPTGAPFVCSSSVMTLYQMLRRSRVPVNVGYGVCVYHVPHRSLRQALGQTFQNLEVPVFTDGWYTAREIAMSRLEAQLGQAGADTIMHAKIVEQEGAFGEHTAEFRAVGHGWRLMQGLANVIPDVDLSVASLIEQGSVHSATLVDHPAKPVR